MYGAGTVFRWTNRGFIAGVLICLAVVSAQAAEPVSVWEVVTTYRNPLDGDGRLTLMSDGKTSKGLPWTLQGETVDFGREGKAERQVGGAYYKGNWVGGWNLHARVLMNGVSLKTKTATPVAMPPNAGETMLGTRPTRALKDSIVDLWEFVAVLPGTNNFIRLTCDFTPNNLVMDGDRVIATYKFDGRGVDLQFVDPQFGKITFMERKDNILTGKGKPVNRKYWQLQFTRVQRQAVYRTSENKEFVLYNNNRVNSPRYQPDYWTTFYWYYYIYNGKRQLLFRSSHPELVAGGRAINWYDQKMVLVAGSLPR